MKTKILLKRFIRFFFSLLLLATVDSIVYSQDTRLAGSVAFCNPRSTIKASPGDGAHGNRSVVHNNTIFNTDFISAGVGGMRNVGSGQIALTGLSGTVTKAFLYWHGISSVSTNVGNSIIVNGSPVTGTNIGVSSTNCWPGNNSQAYRADVTSLVIATGNGNYNLSGFGSLNPNGASLIVFFNDGNNANNRDVVLFEGNDSNIAFAGIAGNPDAPADPEGWNVLLSGITYSSGAANIQLHVADGQNFDDDALKINSVTLVPSGPIFSGSSVPGVDVVPASGNLWDIRTFSVTSFLTPGNNNLNLTTGVGSDCLGLIVALIDLPAGAAPPPPTTQYYSKATGDLHNTLTWGENPDGSGASPIDFGAGKTFNLVNRASNYTMTNDWTVDGTINFPGPGVLQINGFILSEAAITGTGTVSGSASSNLIVTGNLTHTINFTDGFRMLNNLTVSRTSASDEIMLGSSGPLNILNVLTISTGKLNTNNSLTLKSTSTNTARVAAFTANGSILGNVSVERFIPARRAWRILSAPVGGTQTINQAWQEGVATASSNPNPGFGTHITQGTTNGFDNNPVEAMVSIKRYNSSTNSWQTLSNTNSTAVNSDAFLLFVRGDRGVSLGYNDVPATNTTLRANGTLKTGDQTFSVSAAGFTAIPNPFASPINFGTITKENLQNSFYAWDPKMGGANGVGAYVLVSFNGTSYSVTPTPVSPINEIIQSGQGFLVRTLGGEGSLVIKESDKVSSTATNIFRDQSVDEANSRSAGNSKPGLKVNLLTLGNNNGYDLLDGTQTVYDNEFADKIDAQDAIKLPNLNENLAITRNGETLMLERRTAIASHDTVRLKLWNAEQKKYILEINPVNLTIQVKSILLIDNYLHTSIPLNINDLTKVEFTVNADAASAYPDRFMVELSNTASAFDIVALAGKKMISCYPNPITGKNINLQLANQPQGLYTVELVNSIGQLVHKSRISHAGGSAIQRIQLSNTLTTGIYQMRISQNGKSTVLKVAAN